MSTMAISRKSWSALRPMARSAAMSEPADAPEKRLMYGITPASSSARMAPG